MIDIALGICYTDYSEEMSGSSYHDLDVTSYDVLTLDKDYI
jgi:hypothetical protein